MTEIDHPQLDEFFQQYRTACPELEGSVNFVPEVWARIDGKRSFPTVFRRLAGQFMAGSALACLVLSLLTALPHHHKVTVEASYAEALSADNTAEKTYYTEAIRANDNFVPADYRQ